MLFRSLFSFLGGSVFRMVWGEVASFINKREDHKHEVERMELQSKLDDKAAERTANAIRLQAELGVKTIEIQRDADVMKSEAEAFANAMKQAMLPTGIAWVDAWNGSVRPAYATVALGLWALKLWSQWFKMDDFDIGLVAVIAGFFFADRSLRRMSK